jgi:hypothetical protein
MPERLKNIPLLVQQFTAENWHYVMGWVVITFQWAAEIPEPVMKVLVAIITGFGLAFGKWCFERVQKRFKL